MGEKRERKKVFMFEGGFYYYTEKLFDLMALSLLWILCCLPVITAGAAGTALYYTVIKNIKGERGYLAGEYWKAFCLNFKSSTKIWMVVVGLGFLFQLNIGILLKLAEGNVRTILIGIYLFLLFLVAGILIYGFPALARFDMNGGWIIRLALYMTVRYFPVTLLLLGILAGSAAMVYVYPFSILILPALSCTLSSALMEKVLQNHMPKAL